MTKDEKEILEQALNAMERLMRIFRLERILYLVAGFASLALFIYAGYRLFSQREVRTEDMTLILGASGVSTACSSRVAYFLNKAFKLIERIIQKLTDTLG
jgi:hypothetical protein